MTYSIIGAGNIGKALAKAFARKGIEVTLASRRSPEELVSLTEGIGPTVSAKTLREALMADVVFLAIPFRNYKDVADSAEAWQGKLVIDVTNAYGVPVEELGNRPSSAVIAESLPGASLVKAFNHLPAKVLEQDPQWGTAVAFSFSRATVRTRSTKSRHWSRGLVMHRCCLAVSIRVGSSCRRVERAGRR